MLFVVATRPVRTPVNLSTNPRSTSSLSTAHATPTADRPSGTREMKSERVRESERERDNKGIHFYSGSNTTNVATDGVTATKARFVRARPVSRSVKSLS